MFGTKSKKLVIKSKKFSLKISKFGSHISVHIWTEISAETEISDFAGTETGISVPVLISAGTGTEPNFGRSLMMPLLNVNILSLFFP